MKRQKKRDGFTLVEMLAVLVIMALLAAVAIPSMTGFIQDTRKKSETAEARLVYIAAQSAVSEYAAISNETLPDQLDRESDADHEIIKRMEELLYEDAGGNFTIRINESNKVTEVIYRGQRGTIKISAEGVTVLDPIGK